MMKTATLLMCAMLAMPLAVPLARGAQPLPLDGMIDIHVHAEPDSGRGMRSLDALEVARLAHRRGMRGLIFKNHYTETASLAYLVSQVVPGIEVYGGIALNRSVGGLNPVAIERMATMTGGLGRIVWLPTFDSEHNHLTITPNPNFVPISHAGKLLPEMAPVLAMVKKYKLALATGHSSPDECLLIIRAAQAAGIERIVVTHPASDRVKMGMAQQKEAAGLGAWIEYPVMLAQGEMSFEAFARQIREVGPQHVIISTDLGQSGNPTSPDGLLAAIPRLAAAGFSPAEIDLMTKRNPARLLSLD